MLTVGCSEGNDATAWHTRIMNPRMQDSSRASPTYEAIECEFAPSRGVRRRPVHDRRLHRGRLQLRRAAGQSRALRHAPVDLRDPGSQQLGGPVRTGLQRFRHAAGRAPARRGPGAAQADGGRSRGRSRRTPTSRTGERPPSRRATSCCRTTACSGSRTRSAPGRSSRASRGLRATRRVAWHPETTPRRTGRNQRSIPVEAIGNRAPPPRPGSQRGPRADPRWRPVNASRAGAGRPRGGVARDSAEGPRGQ